MMRLLFSFILILFLTFSVKAQFDDETPPEFEETFNKSLHIKPSLDIKFDSRFSFIRNSNVKTFGLKVGLNFNQRVKFGLGLNNMISTSATKIANIDDTVAVNINYSYWSPYIEYVYYSSKKWEFSLITQIGLGEAKYSYLDAIGNEQTAAKTTILTYEPAMQIDYRIVRWVALGTGIGYKLELYNNGGGVTENFSSPQYIFKVKIYLGKIYRTITGKEMPIPVE